MLAFPGGFKQYRLLGFLHEDSDFIGLHIARALELSNPSGSSKVQPGPGSPDGDPTGGAFRLPRDSNSSCT